MPTKGPLCPILPTRRMVGNVYLEPVWLSPRERDNWHKYRQQVFGRPKKQPRDPDAVGGTGDPCPRCVGPLATRTRVMRYQGRVWWRCCGVVIPTPSRCP